MRSRLSLSFGLVSLLAVVALTPAAASAAAPPLFGFASAGDGAGQLNTPAGGAFAADGDYYVADVRNHRVDVFSGTGEFKFAFGKEVNVEDGSDVCTAATECQTGTSGAAAAEIETPEDVALLNGNVYVADGDANRVEVFSELGAFQFAFGKEVNVADASDVCTVGSGCQAGAEHSSENGAMDLPAAVVASDSLLFVADTRNGRIDVYTDTGHFQGAFGKEVKVGGGDSCLPVDECQQGIGGPDAGDISRPRAIAVDQDHRLYILSEQNRRIDVFTTGGEFLDAFAPGVDPAGGDVCTELTGCQEGTEDAEPGSLPNSTGVAVDAGGNVFVSDVQNNRVSKFDDEGNFLDAWGLGVIDGKAETQVCTTVCQRGVNSTVPGAVQAPLGVAVDPQGRIAVNESEGELEDPFARVELFEDPKPETEPETPVIPPAEPAKPVETIAAPPPPAPVSNLVKLGKLKLNPKKGTATLFVTVPNSGKLVLAGNGLKKATATAKRAGTVKLPVVAVGKAKMQLFSSGKVTLKSKLTFSPSGGSPRTTQKKLPLKLKLP
jgi:DNA-binding beta-propeller fold protein YncE